MINVDAFFLLVARMREAQVRYFEHGSAGDLEISEELERKVDDAIRSRGNLQLTLFDLEGGR